MAAARGTAAHVGITDIYSESAMNATTATCIKNPAQSLAKVTKLATAA